MENIIGFIIGVPLVLFALYLCVAIPYSIIIKPMYKGFKNRSNKSLISEINIKFLDKWKDFPGPNYLKFIFVAIGLWGLIEMALYPSISPFNDLFSYLWDKGAITGTLAMSILFGQIACSIVWFPTYAWVVIKVIRNK